MSRISRRRFVVGLAAAAALPVAAAWAAEAGCPPGKAYWETASFEVAYGVWTGPVVEAPFTEAIPSWEAETPAGGWIDVELRARVEGEWTDWAKLGRWHAGGGPVARASLGRQPLVDVDTLTPAAEAQAVQARVGLESPAKLRSFGIALSGGRDGPGRVAPLGVASDLAVPTKSQMVFPSGGRVWCSPTSVSMVMAYWDIDLPVPRVVEGVLDHGPRIAGNWPFNTAFAATHGLRGRVVRLASLAEVEPWTEAGVPVIASIRFRGGELSNSPIWSALGGHLLVIRGFTADGDVLVNDPAAPSDDSVARRYDRFELERAWLGGSNGVVYLIHPPDWAVPDLPRRCA